MNTQTVKAAARAMECLFSAICHVNIQVLAFHSLLTATINQVNERKTKRVSVGLDGNKSFATALNINSTFIESES
jgi:hypothetical protein